MRTSHKSRFPVVASFPGKVWLLVVILAGSATAQLATIEHLAKPGLWPTKVASSSEVFVGAAICAKCHPGIAATQNPVPMARTLARIGETEVLRSHPRLNFQHGPYGYEIVSSPSGTTYTASDGTRSLSASLLWAFGAGTVGQSYLYQQAGQWYEARASFFGTLDNLDFTPGRALASPRTLEEAMSRPVGNTEVVGCFRCHAIGVTSENSLDTTQLLLGVSCEACHGPGAKHATAIKYQGGEAYGRRAEW
jgi:cytochrome c553